jgi:hypothetical protein
MPLTSRRTGSRVWPRLLCALGLAAGLALTPVAASPAATTCLRLQPEFGPPTTQVDVFGCGFRADESVEMTFGSAFSARAWTDGRGEFSTTFNVPGDASLGRSKVTATGLSSKVSVTRNFTVRNP